MSKKLSIKATKSKNLNGTKNIYSIKKLLFNLENSLVNNKNPSNKD